MMSPLPGFMLPTIFPPMADKLFAAHLENLFSCRSCPKVIGEPVTGAVEGAKVMLIGQAPGPHEVVEKRPFAYTAGRKLFQWFASIGVSEERFRERVHIAAVIRCFPGKSVKGGGDRVPDPVEIANCGHHLDRELRLLRPELVIAVGTLASLVLTGEATLSRAVGRIHQVSRASRRFEVVVLPHPSGRSTWLNKPAHKEMLNHSLELIREHPAFDRTVVGITVHPR
jgi:uracil-DNA glycosylase